MSGAETAEAVENLWDSATPQEPLKSSSVITKRDSTVPTPKEIATVKQMFDSATLMKYENVDPFKGSNMMQRTRNKDAFTVTPEVRQEMTAITEVDV